MSDNLATVIGVNGNLVSAITSVPVAMNEVCYVVLDSLDKKRGEVKKLKAEIIRVRDGEFDAQVYEDTLDIKAGNNIELARELLSIELGPGLLGGVFDGLGNPLCKLAESDGYFLKRGSYLETLDHKKTYNFTPVANLGDVLIRGEALGVVQEGLYQHRIMIPFNLSGKYRVINLSDKKQVNTHEVIGQIINISTQKIHDVSLSQRWPIKLALGAYDERLLPTTPLTTKVRMVDTLYPLAEGGTACMPGPFGSGKTVFQQCVSRYGDADIVIIAACGERAGEVAETLREFPELIDPKTGRSLMERTIIICNTSSMPVASREASVYTAITMGEYYRQMGLRVLVLADSTSRWAQAIREMSGRLEEIPGDEAFPAYLGRLIAGFYECAGIVKLNDKNLGTCTGSITLIGSVSPAGGNFEEPVTQSTLPVVGSFLGLTYARSYAKRFPAIAPLDSWSKYLEPMSHALDKKYFPGFVTVIKRLKKYYAQGQHIGDQIKIIGEEDLSLDNFEKYLKAEFFDAVFLQQNAFDHIDSNPPEERTGRLLQQVDNIINHNFGFTSKDQARQIFLNLSNLFRDLNLCVENSEDYLLIKQEIEMCHEKIIL